MASKKKTKGKRYTDVEKAKIIDFVNQVNEEKGRGGVTAAVKKYGATALTISSWLKKKGGPAAPVKTVVKKKADGDVLDQLVTLKAEIAVLEKEAAGKRAQFDKLKKKI